MIGRYLVVNDELQVEVTSGVIFEMEPFRSIIRNDRGMKGDSQGRAKLKARKELAYIYLVTDLNSHLIRNGVSGSELKETARKEVELPEDWTESELVQEAIVKCLESEGPAVQYAKEVLAGLRTSSRATALLRKRLDKVIYDAGESPEELGKVNIQAVSQNITQIISLSNQITPAIEGVKKALSAAELEVREAEEIWGGGELGNREEPN